MSDREQNRLSGRISRYARVGANVGGVAARVAGARLFGREVSDARNAADLTAVLGGLKGPLMKLAQLLATVPDLLPPEFASELQTLQSSAPPMGPAFVKRRMIAELGADWQSRYRDFDRTPAAAASLGQVHRASGHDGAELAVKLQYPDMQSAVEADLGQLGLLLKVQRKFSPEIDTSEIAKELTARLREELDYEREAAHAALYRSMLKDEPLVRVPTIVPELSTSRLLTMSWLEGKPLLGFRDHPLEDRNRIAKAMFRAWWYPFSHFGVIHGDPHLGNYTVIEDQEARSGKAATGKSKEEARSGTSDRGGPLARQGSKDAATGKSNEDEENGTPAGINLLDFGCIRIFPPAFVDGVVNLYQGLKTDDRERIVEAYRRWGFVGLTNATIDALNIWAGFIYGPLLDDRVRTVADGVAPNEYGRREVWEVKQRLKPEAAIIIPREFVLMDRAAIGLGSVMLHLRAEMNFHRLFEETIADFDVDRLEKRQAKALSAVGLAGAAVD
jgi:predicted unusual protein kinase regulating ubiquinone biosynthesis (AarF/ABC1/UbiB family)